MGILIFESSGYSQRVRDNDWTKILGWPGYCVYRHEIDEPNKTLKLWGGGSVGTGSWCARAAGASWPKPMTATSEKCGTYPVWSFARRWWWSCTGCDVRTAG